MSTCFVFPGQGSQFVGMGEELFDKFPEIVQIADKVLGYSLKELCLSDPQKQLNQTEYTQPALFTVSVLSYMDRVSSGTIDVDYLAGHSLGEYAALYAAGAFDFETGLKIVKKRGELMSQAPKGAMAAVLGLDQGGVQRLLEDSAFNHIEMANINTSDQIVLSGDYDEIFAAQEFFENANARYITLKVSAGFHSYLMDSVAEEFDDYIKSFNFLTLQTPVISNLTGRLYPNDDYRLLLKGQINHSVKWHESISWLLQKGCDSVEEIGPGMVLTKMFYAIKQKPMVLNKDVPLSVIKENSQNVFMFAGQGSQYKNMGRELYSSNPLFRKHLGIVDQVLTSKLNISLIDQLYHPRSDEKFDDVRITHPSILCFQYAIAKMAIESGVEAEAVLGHSLGEYVATIIADVLSLEDALDIVIKQADLLYHHTKKGRMMVILDSSELFYANSSLFDDVYFASKNYQKAFVVAGEQTAMMRCVDKLVQAAISFQLLPVTIAFHSPLIDTVKQEFIDYADRFEFDKPNIPMYSSYAKNQITNVTAEHLWHAISQPLDFIEMIKKLPTSEMTFIDMSPSGSLSLFLKYGVTEELMHTFLINQYGHDDVTFNEALRDLL